MKVKTITCHDVYNVGASLQAYALAAYLRECGHEVEIIDYKPDYLDGHYRLFGVNNPRYDKPVLREIYTLLKLPGRVRARFGRRKREFDAFTGRYLPLTETRYTSNEQLKSDPPQADVYLAGSDQIWNPLFPNGKDPAFYLDFAPDDCVRASYAASFAVDAIPEKLKKQIGSRIDRLDFVSVRERSGVEICRELGRADAQQVLDPVFLLDRAHWEALAKPVELPESYVLLYDFDRNEKIGEFARGLARENGWKVYSVLPHEKADRCFQEAGPREFLSLMLHAQAVVSNSFHATAFSLIFERPFWVFDREEHINARMRDLLGALGLEHHGMTEVKNMSWINFDMVRQRLEEQIAGSKAYLDKVLMEAKAHD